MNINKYQETREKIYFTSDKIEAVHMITKHLIMICLITKETKRLKTRINAKIKRRVEKETSANEL